MPLLLLLPLLLPPLLSLLPLLSLPLLLLLLRVFRMVEVEVAPSAAGAAAAVAIANQAPSGPILPLFLVVSLWWLCGTAVVVMVLPVIKISIVQKK